MAIKRVEIKDFLVFKGEFAVDFCPGVNVIIGGNATGKTTLLKCLYGVYNKKVESCFFSTNIMDDVSYGEGIIKLLCSNDTETLFEQGPYNENPHINPHTGKILKDGVGVSCYTTKGSPGDAGSHVFSQSVFIPDKDMLAHSFGFLPWLRERQGVPFDDTLSDIVSKAQLFPKNDISHGKLCEDIRKIIGGEVAYDNDTFYVLKDKERKLVPFSLEASGYKKLGLLWKLIRNGLLEQGSILFWDEPENSLNPELVPVLVSILLDLAANGVQIFIASHDYNFVRYFDVRENNDIPVLFHNLTKNDGGQIICESSRKYLKLTNNLLEDSADELFEAVAAYGMGFR